MYDNEAELKCVCVLRDNSSVMISDNPVCNLVRFCYFILALCRLVSWDQLMTRLYLLDKKSLGSFLYLLSWRSKILIASKVLCNEFNFVQVFCTNFL